MACAPIVMLIALKATAALTLDVVDEAEEAHEAAMTGIVMGGQSEVDCAIHDSDPAERLQ